MVVFMKISYDWEFGQIYVEISDADIDFLEEKKQLSDTENHTLLLKNQIISLFDKLDIERDEKNPTTLVSITLSDELFENLKENLFTNHIERIAGSLSVEFFKREL